MFDADHEAFGAVDAEFFEENSGMTDDGGVEAESDGGDDDEPPRSLRTPFMAVVAMVGLTMGVVEREGCGS